MTEEQWDIFAPFSQRRDPQAENVQAKIQIATKGALGYRLLEEPVGGGKNADIDRNAPGAAHGTDFLFLNSPQKFSLEIDRKLADLVKKHRATFGASQQPVLGLVRSCECAFHIPEELAFDQGGHQRAAVDGNEGLVVETSGVMNGASDHLLAGAALAENQHGV